MKRPKVAPVSYPKLSNINLVHTSKKIEQSKKKLSKMRYTRDMFYSVKKGLIEDKLGILQSFENSTQELLRLSHF